MKNTYTLTPLYIFLLIITGFTGMLSYFSYMGISKEDMGVLSSCFSVLASLLGITLLRIEQYARRHKEYVLTDTHT